MGYLKMSTYTHVLNVFRLTPFELKRRSDEKLWNVELRREKWIKKIIKMA